MKAYTDLEQSKKLAEILPIESADMTYLAITEGVRDKMAIIGWKVTVGLDIAIKENLFSYRYGYMFPCWSLAALLRLIPNFNMFKRTIECKIETIDHLVDKACDLIDAAFEMICWLKENNKL